MNCIECFAGDFKQARTKLASDSVVRDCARQTAIKHRLVQTISPVCVIQHRVLLILLLSRITTRLGLPLKLAIVPKRYSKNRFNDQLADRGTWVQRYVTWAEVD